jgi:hypothetical protein|tara:strand:- start:39 stop:308 length:270 start_codon:yes stop_codon:yes gene_type:complete
MHQVKVNKYYHGMLSVRDYDCEKAMKMGGLQIIHKGKIVLEVGPASLGSALINNKNKPTKSKFPPYKTYRLVDFRFTQKQEAGEQQELL